MIATADDYLKGFFVYSTKQVGKFKVHVEARRLIAHRCLSFGVSAGSNHIIKGRSVNFFIEVNFLVWRAAVEVRW